MIAAAKDAREQANQLVAEQAGAITKELGELLDVLSSICEKLEEDTEEAPKAQGMKP